MVLVAVLVADSRLSSRPDFEGSADSVPDLEGVEVLEAVGSGDIVPVDDFVGEYVGVVDLVPVPDRDSLRVALKDRELVRVPVGVFDSEIDWVLVLEGVREIVILLLELGVGAGVLLSVGVPEELLLSDPEGVPDEVSLKVGVFETDSGEVLMLGVGVSLIPLALPEREALKGEKLEVGVLEGEGSRLWLLVSLGEVLSELVTEPLIVGVRVCEGDFVSLLVGDGERVSDLVLVAEAELVRLKVPLEVGVLLFVGLGSPVGEVLLVRVGDRLLVLVGDPVLLGVRVRVGVSDVVRVGVREGLELAGGVGDSLMVREPERVRVPLWVGVLE